MRIVTWNCFRGSIPQRLERLKPLGGDIVALQECRRPADRSESVLWRGTLEQHGVAVASSNPALRLEPLPVPADFPSTVLPVIVHAPEPFILISLWALPEPSYESFALKALSTVAVGISLPVFVIGDFNSTPVLQSQRRTSRELMRRLKDEFGLVSAYHSYLGAIHGREPHPTFFMNRREDRPFHLDYCFVPEAWAGKIIDVKVGRFDEWHDSDHRPITVALDL